MEKHSDEIEIDLLEVIHILFSRFWIIVSVGLVAAVVCFIISKFVLTPTYESTTKIYILNKSDNTTVTYSDVQMGTQLTKDYAELINSRYVLEKVIANLSLTDMEYDDLLEKVSVNTPTDTRIVSITVEHTDPVQAMKIADCIREVAGEHIQNVMDIDAVNVVEPANLPTEKAGPSVTKWTMFGGIAGVFFVCVIILILYLLDDSIKSSDDVEKYLGLSTLALIPVAMEEETVKKGKTKRK
ncbi:MAG: Wzz/FepE/Etk N-terminal domain-containing protein [Bacillus sp. (in: Bacteria)]|nr:Wzz/FepE/Etk N-terminal domain-containing protein [Bacillus sp. (in: firmicutes)]MCM1426019.1 Wzz/FepE/Etk N-terminal domain-containing protein [Eubacterium sp.]